MLAVSRTLKADRMVAFEFLRIVERNGGLVYVAQPDGRPPTDFVLTEVSADSATFENPAHDFPKMIRYSKRSDGTLEARISDGGQKGASFIFRRMPWQQFRDIHRLKLSDGCCRQGSASRCPRPASIPSACHRDHP